MKKLLIALLFVLFATPNLYAEPAEIRVDPFFTGTVAAGTTGYSDTIEFVRKTGYAGFFSIQPIITGAGVLKIDYQLNNGGGWFSANIVEITATTTTGKMYWYPVSGVNMFSGYMRFVFTETGSANPVTVTSLNVCRQ